MYVRKYVTEFSFIIHLSRRKQINILLTKWMPYSFLSGIMYSRKTLIVKQLRYYNVITDNITRYGIFGTKLKV